MLFIHSLSLLCEKIEIAFLSQTIEEGYDYIVLFADCLDEQVALGNLTKELQLQVREHLMILQLLLDNYDDHGVAILFREQIAPIVKDIPVFN